MSEETVGMGLVGEIAGVAEVRDKHGNLKGSFTFGGKATLEQMEEVRKANPDVPLTINQSGDSHGSDTSHGGA